VIDPAAALVVSGRVQPGTSDRALTLAKSIAALLALALHAALLWGWMHVSRWQPDVPPQSFEIVFVARQTPPEHGIPPMPVAPVRPIRKVASARPSAPERTALQAIDVAQAPPAPPKTESRLRLFRPDGGLRLTEQAVDVPVFDDQARIRYDRRVALPGHSDAAAAEAVALRLRRSLTPEDVVKAVLRFLFAAPQPDDCPKIEARLIAGDPGVSREIDLHKFHRYCQ
jgi:hypothetical protein